MFLKFGNPSFTFSEVGELIDDHAVIIIYDDFPNDGSMPLWSQDFFHCSIKVKIIKIKKLNNAINLAKKIFAYFININTYDNLWSYE